MKYTDVFYSISCQYICRIKLHCSEAITVQCQSLFKQINAKTFNKVPVLQSLTESLPWRNRIWTIWNITGQTLIHYCR